MRIVITHNLSHVVDAHRYIKMNILLKAFIKGAHETPKAYFAPLIAIWRLLLKTTESLISRS